jgi:hypothetical protein
LAAKTDDKEVAARLLAMAADTQKEIERIEKLGNDETPTHG